MRQELSQHHNTMDDIIHAAEVASTEIKKRAKPVKRTLKTKIMVASPEAFQQELKAYAGIDPIPIIAKHKMNLP